MIRAEFGTALGNRVTWGKMDWILFSGASSLGINNTTRALFVDDVHRFINNSLNDAPFSDRYFVEVSQVGSSDDFRARLVVGGHLAILALEGYDAFYLGS